MYQALPIFEPEEEAALRTLDCFALIRACGYESDDACVMAGNQWDRSSSLLISCTLGPTLCSIIHAYFVLCAIEEVLTTKELRPCLRRVPTRASLGSLHDPFTLFRLLKT